MNKIMLKTGKSPEIVSELLDTASFREPILEASSGFLWVKNLAGDKLRIAGPRATESFWFKGIISNQITEYPGTLCDVGDALFLQSTSTIQGQEIPAGSLIVKVANTEDNIGSWYVFDKVSQQSLKISSDKLTSTRLIDALEEICGKLVTADEKNLTLSNGIVNLKDDVSLLTLSTKGDLSGPAREACVRIGSISPQQTTLLLFPKNLLDVNTYILGDIFEQSNVGMSHSHVALSAIGSKNFSSVSSSPNGRAHLITCTYSGNTWFALRFPSSQTSAIYFSGWRNFTPIATTYLDTELSNIAILEEDDYSEGLSIINSSTKRGVEIGDNFYFKLPATSDQATLLEPETGATYYDTDLKMQMVYDSGKWVSAFSVKLSFGASSADGQYLTSHGVQSSLSGYLLPHNAVIRSISVIAGGGPTNKGLELRKNGGSLVTAFALSNRQYINTGLNISFSQGDFIQLFAVTAGTAVTSIVADIEIAYTK